jgi:hypothetical protein
VRRAATIGSAMKWRASGNHLSYSEQGGIVASATRIGTAGLQGWRRKVGDALAQPLAQRTPLDGEQVRAAVGALFFALSLMYVVKTVGIASRELREG